MDLQRNGFDRYTWTEAQNRGDEMSDKTHWENVYSTKPTDSVSWFQPHAEKSLKLIKQLQFDQSAKILDVGGGASTLVDDLIKSGYNDIYVLDISSAALDVAQKRLDAKSKQVHWLVQDVTQLELPAHSIDLWHDRAVFHFLTNNDDRKKYVSRVLNAVKPGGHVIISTFAEDGPEKCSGLNVQRYNSGSLHSEFGDPFTLLGHEKEMHHTPFGTEQSFIYCYCRVNND